MTPGWHRMIDSWVTHKNPWVTRLIPRWPFSSKVHRGCFWVLCTRYIGTQETYKKSNKSKTTVARICVCKVSTLALKQLLFSCDCRMLYRRLQNKQRNKRNSHHMFLYQHCSMLRSAVQLNGFDHSLNIVWFLTRGTLRALINHHAYWIRRSQRTTQVPIIGFYVVSVCEIEICNFHKF